MRTLLYWNFVKVSIFYLEMAVQIGYATHLQVCRGYSNHPCLLLHAAVTWSMQKKVWGFTLIRTNSGIFKFDTSFSYHLIQTSCIIRKYKEYIHFQFWSTLIKVVTSTTDQVSNNTINLGRKGSWLGCYAWLIKWNHKRKCLYSLFPG